MGGVEGCTKGALKWLQKEPLGPLKVRGRDHKGPQKGPLGPSDADLLAGFLCAVKVQYVAARPPLWDWVWVCARHGAER